MSYPLNTTYTTIPIVPKVMYVVHEIVGERKVPLLETPNYLVALAKITELRKKFKYIYKFKIEIKC